MTDTPRRPEEVFGQWVRGLRQALGYSQQELADLMREQGFDWSQTIVSKTEQAGRPLRLDEAQALAELFGFQLSNLLRPLSDLGAHRWVIRCRKRLDAARVAKALADHEYEEARLALVLAQSAEGVGRDVKAELDAEFRAARDAGIRQGNTRPEATGDGEHQAAE